MEYLAWRFLTAEVNRNAQVSLTTKARKHYKALGSRVWVHEASPQDSECTQQLVSPVKNEDTCFGLGTLTWMSSLVNPIQLYRQITTLRLKLHLDWGFEG